MVAMLEVSPEERERVRLESDRCYQLLKRKYDQRCVEEAARRYADPLRVLEGKESFEMALPLGEWLNLRRAGFRM